jgi:hypothetical protein
VLSCSIVTGGLLRSHTEYLFVIDMSTNGRSIVAPETIVFRRLAETAKKSPKTVS